MTEIPDVRAAAWVCAWDALAAVQQLKQPPDGPRVAPEPLPDLYWATMAEAAIYAQLAQVDSTTGITAGVILNEDARRRTNVARLTDLLASDKAKRASEHVCEYDDPSKCGWPGHRR